MIVLVYNTGYSSKNWKTLSTLNIKGVNFDVVHWGLQWVWLLSIDAIFVLCSVNL
jgi:hypothetical protein